MPNPAFIVPNDPVPADVITLSEGPANVLSGQWPDRQIEAVTRLELHGYYTKNARARALVYAGGGYHRLMHDKEGVEVALWLNSLGIDAYVMAHRLPGQGNHDKDMALKDGLTCLDYLAQFKDLPLLHVGLSSGGHLAGVMACQDHALKAAGALIAYAPINANHKDYKFPVGKPDYPPVEKQDFYNDWPIGVAAEPHGVPDCPVFLAYGLYDEIVPVDHALNMIKAGQNLKRDVEAHIFDQAPHGFALRETTGTHANWPELAARWIDRVLA
ncbi:prolyl oligopeptidase family serine peptidase [Asticcacaulis sp. SL142]|uniref:alpha/beta hydrolase family protein n=1 Tax=Asticcacaulis sp. SL142 TaxID=2995155 RepID=UPI00226C678B|nr:prolyl oligopeptidase family serine peptidase [Asticcacaulis sp. SL142]WAC47540.1 prolyl oligopeptidase family serine peptidase [Asticcacaulis sp. SL142]